MKNLFIKLFYTLFLCLFATSFACAFEFKKDLKMGDYNNDVVELQKILNQYTETTVALSGPGSFGNETNYFGSLTKQAVIRFQEKNRNTILVPNSLSSGTGYVGRSTREVLSNLGKAVVADKNVINSINTVKAIGSTSVNTQNSSITNSFNEINPLEKSGVSSFFNGFLNNTKNQSLSSLKTTLDKATLDLFPSFAKSVRIYSVSPYQVKPGQKVVVSGTAFAEGNNTFSFGNVSTGGVNCLYSTYCEVLVPGNTPFGEQNIFLSNSNGNSTNQGFPVKVFVTNNPILPSAISSASPSDIKASEINISIVLKGERLASQGNYIYTPLGNVGPYNSSDGKTLTFSLKEMKDINKLIERGRLLKTEIIPLPFMVSNEYGLSKAFFVNLLVNK